MFAPRLLASLSLALLTLAAPAALRARTEPAADCSAFGTAASNMFYNITLGALKMTSTNYTDPGVPLVLTTSDTDSSGVSYAVLTVRPAASVHYPMLIYLWCCGRPRRARRTCSRRTRS